MKKQIKERDPFPEFIKHITPYIYSIIRKLKDSSGTNSESEVFFENIFLSENVNATDQKINSISTVMAVLIYDCLCIGLKTLKRVELLGEHSYFNSIHMIFDRITEKNLDIPLFHSPIFPLHSLIELFVSKPYISNECLKFLLENTSNSINYSQMKFPYYYDRSIGQNKIKNQGQVFTPISVIDFIFDQVIVPETEIILDPAAGTGVFLLRALENLPKIDLSEVIKVIAIEKDPILSLICESALKVFCKLQSQSIECQVYNQDFFQSASILSELRSEKHGVIAILMNPPYTRQELIPIREKDFIRNRVSSTSVISDFKRKYTSFRVSGQSSLYIYFILYISEFLNPQDRLGLIIPNSWMDVRYGLMLQLFLLDHYNIELIVSTRLEKLIPSVEVNTVILTLEVKSHMQSLEVSSSSHEVKFIRINSKADLKLLANYGIKKALPMIKDSVFASVMESKLLLEPKWGIFVKAPRYFLDYLDNTKDNMKFLRDYASVRRGFTSGANDFFYVGKPGRMNRFFVSSIDLKDGSLILKPQNNEILHRLQEQGFLLEEESFTIEREYWMHSDTNNHEFQKESILYTTPYNEIWIPNYLIKSPKELEGFKVTSENLTYVVIIIPKKSSLKLKPGIRKYIKWGETWRPIKGNPYALRTTCANRKFWYSLPDEYYHFCPILCIMTINDRYPFFYNPHNYYFDARLYGITPLSEIKINEEDLTTFLFLFLNTVFVSIQIELSGRENLGEGGLDVKVYEYQDIKIPQFKFLGKKSFLASLFQKTLLSKPSSYIKSEQPSSKQELDQFLREIYSLSDEKIEKMHKSLQKIVQARIDKAKTDFSYIS
ncbi:hypothetical protein CEE45_07190 [Candidatus Heimdallarchaeota archaeon B3_Heim]|nr:MAG: hypothetical protein CEE45_07190 [Candidatus Heimdallarchaeota archaeon B3_Heim]